PAHAEDEDVGGVGQQRQPHQHLEGARPKQQPHARAREHADGQCVDDLHQARTSAALPFSPSASGSTGATTLRGLRSDWCASATRISSVAPTTSMYTPRSNSSTVERCSSPTSGSGTCTDCAVRKGFCSIQATRPAPSADSRPAPIQYRGCTRSRASTQMVPLVMYCTI